MEPFDIRSTPARISPGSLAATGAVTLLLLILAVQDVRLAVAIVTGDGDRGRALVVLGVGLVFLAVIGRLMWPNWLVINRYLRQDRGKQVLTFRLEESGWRWLQVGTDVLVPWESLSVRVKERTADRVVVRMEHPAPVLCSRDAVSRRLHRNLRKLKASDIPFTLSDPTEDELADAIAAQSAGRVTLAR